MSTIQFIYRMTHIGNIPHILQYGITSHNSPNKNPNYINIGDTTLISARDSLTVDVEGKLTDLKDFIPFYFGTRMPMLHIIQNGFNNVKKTPPEDIVYIKCSIQDVIRQKVDYIFSDGHAKNAFTLFYSEKSINDIDNIVDMKAVKNSYWGGEENLDVKRKKQAEFLVKGDIPANCIKMFGCYNEFAKERLIGMGICGTMIQVASQAYY